MENRYVHRQLLSLKYKMAEKNSKSKMIFLKCLEEKSTRYRQ